MLLRRRLSLLLAMAVVLAMMLVMAVPGFAQGHRSCEDFGQAVASNAKDFNNPQNPGGFGKANSELAQANDDQPGIGDVVKEQHGSVCEPK